MRVFLGGTPRPATLRITDGRVESIEAFDPAADLVLPEHQVLLPGLVDSHVHLDEPGRTEWEGFLTGTAAAAAGGITTVVDMPLNSVPVTTTVPALAQKRAASVGKLAVDIAYWGGAVPENLGSLRELAQAGVVGFKCFLSPSGIDEFGHLDADQLEAALTEIATFDGVLIVHAEDPDHLHPDGALGVRYTDFLASRPPASEASAVAQVIEALDLGPSALLSDHPQLLCTRSIGIQLKPGLAHDGQQCARAAPERGIGSAELVADALQHQPGGSVWHLRKLTGGGTGARSGLARLHFQGRAR